MVGVGIGVVFPRSRHRPPRDAAVLAALPVDGGGIVLGRRAPGRIRSSRVDQVAERRAAGQDRAETQRLAFDTDGRVGLLYPGDRVVLAAVREERVGRELGRAEHHGERSPLLRDRHQGRLRVRERAWLPVVAVGRDLQQDVLVPEPRHERRIEGDGPWRQRPKVERRGGLSGEFLLVDQDDLRVGCGRQRIARAGRIGGHRKRHRRAQVASGQRLAADLDAGGHRRPTAVDEATEAARDDGARRARHRLGMDVERRDRHRPRHHDDAEEREAVDLRDQRVALAHRAIEERPA